MVQHGHVTKMTLQDEIEIHVKKGLDLIFLRGILAMTRVPELERQLYRALRDVENRITEQQEKQIYSGKHLTKNSVKR